MFDFQLPISNLQFENNNSNTPSLLYSNSFIEKQAQVGDYIVMIGGKIGQDGIHGATFSSEALHEASPSTAVQIGDAITQKN